MTRLVLEATEPLSRLDVKDWLYKIGCIAYEVKPIPDDPPSNGKNQRFQIVTSDVAAQRAISLPPGQEISRVAIVIRPEAPN
ncbi:MAG TPA: hypothetical protein VKV95_07280 [Terriglobia bacterium]|nr:hypothetical protein [Terriglobia bacterium]